MISIYKLFELHNAMIRRTIAKERKAVAGNLALQMVRKRNKSLFDRYKKLNILRRKMKEQMRRQYGSRAKSASMKYR